MVLKPRPRRRAATAALPPPLTDTPVTAIAPDGPVAQTQRLIDTLLQAPGRTVHWPLYGPAGVSLAMVLRDVKALATLVLHHATPEDLRLVAPSDVWTAWSATAPNPCPRVPSTRRTPGVSIRPVA
ncbi:hypothetical protein QA995_37595 [Streptomyces scabiei]|uniref:hypothetical protein n=1 Tax=Streptomyces scabiei TaxID=1930 RepID=UPI002FF32BF0